MVRCVADQLLRFGDDAGHTHPFRAGGEEVLVRRRPLAITVAAAVALALLAPQLAGSSPQQDPRARREQVRAEAAQVASTIDTSKASLAEIDAALQVLEDNLATQRAALTRTEAEVAQAEQDIVDAEAAIERLTGEIAVLSSLMRDRAVQAYVNPPSADVLTVLDTNDFTTAANRKFYIELRAQSDADIADRLQGASSDLDHQKRKATEAKAQAEAKRAEQAERTEAVEAAAAQQERLSSGLEATIDSQVARSIELAATDRELSSQIAREQAALIARLAAQKAAQEEAARQAAAARARQEHAAREAASSGPTPTAPTPTPAPTAPRPTTPPPPSNQAPDGGETAPLPPVSSGGGGTGTGGISLCTVGGITVNCQIQGQVANLLNAARSSGLVLSGGGYRDSANQIRLRQQHCGTSYYAIYEMPASQCSPPTAKPGTSQHEIGLAIDFSNCSSRGSACYRWLAGNASRFGFYNLPSEPWHWSTSGN